ncbi:MAG: COG1361 S-layer family protein [Candidatus Woesearchaeota archaeon]
MIKKNSMIKKSAYMLIVLLLAILFINIVSANLIANKAIRVSMVNQEPDPIEPGKYLDVRFKIENYGSDSTAPVVVGIKEKFPFTVLDDSRIEQNIGVLRGMQRTADSQIVSWRLRVDKDAAEGLNEITVYYMELEGKRAKVIYEDKFHINVRTSDTVLSVVDIRTIPEIVEPGIEAELILTLENKGQSFIKDVSVDLDLKNSDISTVGTTSERIIQRLDGNQRIDVSFRLLPDSLAELRAHQIPITLKYKDNINNEYSHQSTFGLVLMSGIDYIINVDGSDILAVGESGDVNLRISNRGLNNIRFLTAELKPSLQYEILSSPEIYIGRIDSDDFDTLSYKIHANQADAEGRITLRLALTFKDSYNHDFTAEEEVVLQLFTKDEIKLYGLGGDGGSVGIVLVVIIAVLGGAYYFYRKRKKKRLEQEKD